MSKTDRILISIAVAVGAPLATALGDLSAGDLHHPGTWLGALILGVASGLSLLIHYWLQQSPIQLQSPIVRVPAAEPVTPAAPPVAEYTTTPENISVASRAPLLPRPEAIATRTTTAAPAQPAPPASG